METDISQSQQVQDQQVKNNDLASIEEQLIKLFKKDRHAWVSMYRLIEYVKENELYKNGEYGSFSAWVISLSERTGVHESVIWKRHKAGQSYDLYTKSMKAKGYDVKPLEAVKIFPEGIELITKIAGANEDIRDRLITKLVNNELSNSDLRIAWNEKSLERKMLGLPSVRKNGYQPPIDMGYSAETSVKAY